ncbi:hypothetical protein VOLCADRAFT_94936 [Volvox carteri f. nagariensis]|uniref:Apple domain-containing protein n=1 Tax=Volvox carteri f. nagariensis TaxID=3068 RepID=D8U662_VOLCA|nr:uncharacterized protein VOLCADRAFT_94936 [Volvox carteri f. nagariensis]EFJ44798.1 hypothetical protein VOLCADRAFT_94936 [Volvox carteri f. nagariensis]|eukprot:XP_002954081.1 hypothetical protein VOLCADRAFT_94936 [Volvox carteri f. nagariensis]
MPVLAVLLLLAFTAAVRLHAAAPPASVVAVANRDAEGAIVLDADEAHNFQPSAAACRDSCLNTTGCNVWVWCGAVSGCSSGVSYTPRDLSKYQQCWLKYDTPPKQGASTRGMFLRFKNAPDQPSGWMSGTTVTNFTDSAPFPEENFACECLAKYQYLDYRFEGMCANLQGGGPVCVGSSNCSADLIGTFNSCPLVPSCTVLLDTDLNATKIITPGDYNTADSAEDCCYQCASTQGCNLWTWCADPTACNGERYRFRQCWLKQADPKNPQPKKGYGGSPGWISGVRLTWMPM